MDDDAFRGLPDMNDLETAAVGVHEIYRSFVKAGFSKMQAFEITKDWWLQIVAEGGGRKDGE